MAEFIHVVCPSCAAVNRLPAARAAQKPNCGTCHQPLFPGKPVAADAGRFDRHLGRGNIPVVVDFWAPWCGPCRMVSPALERLAGELAGKLKLVKVNTDEEEGLASRFGIRGIPTMVLFEGGRERDRVTGALPLDDLRRWLEARLTTQGTTSRG
jgi:thioredoxin 2